MNVRSRIDQIRNQAKSVVPATSGGLKTHQNDNAMGAGAMNMNGCRRPQRLDRHLSEREPTSGSETASTKIEIVGTRPASSTSKPSTWL